MIAFLGRHNRAIFSQSLEMVEIILSIAHNHNIYTVRRPMTWKTLALVLLAGRERQTRTKKMPRNLPPKPKDRRWAV